MYINYYTRLIRLIRLQNIPILETLAILGWKKNELNTFNLQTKNFVILNYFWLKTEFFFTTFFNNIILMYKISIIFFYFRIT